MKGQKRLAVVEQELEAEQEQFAQMCDSYIKRDGVMTDGVLKEQISGTMVTANARKGEILKLFTEV